MPAEDAELPPREERLSLREAAALFQPPATKKALESFISGGKLQVWARASDAGAP